MSLNYGSDSVRRLIQRLRVFLKVLFRSYLTFPLRLVHHLCRTALRLYYDLRSIACRRRFQCIHTDEHLERVASSNQPAMLLPPSNHQPQIQPLPGPTSCSSCSLLPVHALPSSSNSVLQSPPAAPVESQNRSPANFDPFTPSDVIRYNKAPSINPDTKECESIDPLTINFLDAHERDSGNWRACIHPEGALYFHDSRRHVYTDSNLRFEDLRCRMDSCVDEILALMPPELQSDCDKIELVVQSTRKAGVKICRYYFIDHDKHVLFWLHKLPTKDLWCGVKGVEKLSHIKYAVEYQYWQVFN
ncbi:uncharacterized protein EDB93DRAFT_726589 [Suillus bovinus]|uniref:uncharacterized protein n=1 Tax=Suillus bovinus TaxID=48563 RepID=UPI001B863DB6|nr:uncharacterized protein EDB93DRAFT_726589 [Suillus bovinus]KAG2138065.1 hypothetical protein EDB93DRAFT_726589 [Suillus bovinus]